MWQGVPELSKMLSGCTVECYTISSSRQLYYTKVKSYLDIGMYYSGRVQFGQASRDLGQNSDLLDSLHLCLAGVALVDQTTERAATL